MPLLDDEQLTQMRQLPGEVCRVCKRLIRKNYCRQCDEFYWQGHATGCEVFDRFDGEHQGHRTYDLDTGERINNHNEPPTARTVHVNVAFGRPQITSLPVGTPLPGNIQLNGRNWFPQKLVYSHKELVAEVFPHAPPWTEFIISYHGRQHRRSQLMFLNSDELLTIDDGMSIEVVLPTQVPK